MSGSGATAYLGIGGNLGDVRETFTGALAALSATDGIVVRRVSPLYETPAVGGPGNQPSYLNAVLEIQTRLNARELLQLLLRIEADFARVREIRWGPRTLDLDLLLFGPDQHISDPPLLMVPHPRLAERAFVLEPLAALVPSLVVPGTGRTVEELRDTLSASDRVAIRLISQTWS